jgi:glycosyltransferase involved in cell wall biosynthesis
VVFQRGGNVDDITVLIPHIPVRLDSLARAVKSVALQTRRPSTIHTEVDINKTGSAATRNRGLLSVRTKWVAFLDDDDEMMPQHLEVLLNHAVETGADVVYSGCYVVGPKGEDVPLIDEWGRFGCEFDGDLLREKSYIPVTSLVNADLSRNALFGPPIGLISDYDDWGFYLRLLDIGAKFSHIPVKTWIWNHHGKNTSGRPDRWT